jgi:sarcosine oxidase gamma subunit
MSIQVEGKIERKGFGPGTWAIVSNSGETYELHQAPAELQQAGLIVKVSGKIREDVMTFAMIGPVLEVEQFEVKS